MVKSKKEDSCPCCSGKNYGQCCQPYLVGALPAPDAEALMRSRYTAYTLEDEAYLQNSWHPKSRPAEVVRKSEPCKWISLNVISHYRGGQTRDGQTATVEFIADYKINGRAEKLHEVSRFVVEDGQWFYVDGDILN